MLLADQEKLWEETKGTPLISSTSNLTLTQQPTMCVCVLLRVVMTCKCLQLHILKYDQKHLCQVAEIVLDQWSVYTFTARVCS